MQWLLVVMISLCWWEVDAIKGLTSEQCIKNMYNDWHNKTRYKAYKLKEAEIGCLHNTEIGERSDAPPGVRQDCRTLSDEKRASLFRCIQWMCTDRPAGSGGLTRYQVFASQHRATSSPGAHYGPCFLAWHRNFLRR